MKNMFIKVFMVVVVLIIGACSQLESNFPTESKIVDKNNNTQISNVILKNSLYDGLVAYYPLDSNTNNIVSDINNGISYGATLTKDSLIGNYYEFNEINNYITTDTII